MSAVKEAAVSHLTGLMDSMIRFVILRLPGAAWTKHHSQIISAHSTHSLIYPAVL
jgi:hypothetical protein